MKTPDLGHSKWIRHKELSHAIETWHSYSLNLHSYRYGSQDMRNHSWHHASKRGDICAQQLANVESQAPGTHFRKSRHFHLLPGPEEDRVGGLLQSWLLVSQDHWKGSSPHQLLPREPTATSFPWQGWKKSYPSCLAVSACCQNLSAIAWMNPTFLGWNPSPLFHM